MVPTAFRASPITGVHLTGIALIVSLATITTHSHHAGTGRSALNVIRTCRPGMGQSVLRALTKIRKHHIGIVLTVFLATTIIRIRHTGTEPVATSALGIYQNGMEKNALRVVTIT